MADIEEARKQFERIDTDGDGFITAAEFKTALAQGGDWNVTESVAEAISPAATPTATSSCRSTSSGPT